MASGASSPRGNGSGSGNGSSGGNGAGSQSPGSQRAFARTGSALSGGAEDAEVEDASMSNDESMSSTSSLEMDEAADRADRDLFAELSAAAQSGRSPSGSFDFPPLPRVLPPLDGRRLSFDVAAFAEQLEADRQPSNPDEMWLHAQLAPAMAKSARSSDPASDMEDDEAKGDGNSTSNGNGNGGNRRVPWASAEARVELPGGARLAAAKNEVTGVQVRLRSNYAFSVATDASNWLLPHGHSPRARVQVDQSFVPPQLQVEALLVGYVQDENDELMMEFLDRGGHSPTAETDHAVYIRLRVTSAVAPGVYELPVRIFTQAAGFQDEELSWVSAIHVRVVNVQLPPPADWSFHLDLWQHYTSIARAHSVALWSDRHFELIDRYLAPLAELGQKSVSIVATEVPWAGQQCYLEHQYPSALFEHAILEVSDDPDRGQPLTVDFRHFDRLLQLAHKHHMDSEIEVFGLLAIWRDVEAGFGGPTDHLAHHAKHLQRRRSSSSGVSNHSGSAANNTNSNGSGTGQDAASSSVSGGNAGNGQDGDSARSRSLSNASSLGIGPGTAAAGFAIDSWRIRCQNRSTQRVRYLRRLSEVEQVIEQFYSHCVTLGVVDRVRICADEPSDVTVFYEQLQFLQRVAPGFKVKLALNNLDFFNYAPPQIVDFVPLLPLACADLEVTHRIKSEIHARSGKLCWYVCCGPAFPNQFVSSPLVEGELVGFLTHFLELDGFLRWNYCLWPARPWDSLKWRAPSWKVGDMYFVLPGKDGAPVETLRLESLRFAIQAFELLALAQSTLPPVQMQQLRADVAQHVLRTSDFAEFCRYREKARTDLYSLDPLDYQRARTLILDTLAATTTANGSPRTAQPRTH